MNAAASCDCLSHVPALQWLKSTCIQRMEDSLLGKEYRTLITINAKRRPGIIAGKEWGRGFWVLPVLPISSFPLRVAGEFWLCPSGAAWPPQMHIVGHQWL